MSPEREPKFHTREEVDALHYEIAAAHACHIVAGHPYWDGNKRTGGAAAMTFLERNGVETSRLPEQQTYESLIRIADRRMDRFELGL